jgi:hypothetical protein
MVFSQEESDPIGLLPRNLLDGELYRTETVSGWQHFYELLFKNDKRLYWFF